jgi:hypothetical protein
VIIADMRSSMVAAFKRQPSAAPLILSLGGAAKASLIGAIKRRDI